MCMSNDEKINKEHMDKILKACNNIDYIHMRMELSEKEQGKLNNKIDEEVKDREKDTGEIKDNYIKRFDKVDSLLCNISAKVSSLTNDINELKLKRVEDFQNLLKKQNSFLWKAIFIFAGFTLFLFISYVWKEPISNLWK